MTVSRGLDGATGGLRRAAGAGMVAVAIFAGVGIGPATLASGSGYRSAAGAVAAPAAVKYYVVPSPGKGATETLYDIAHRTLGNGSLYPEIFRLNKGRLEPNGERMESPRTIHVGWLLVLPADARGPGVRFGPLPGAASVAVPPTAAPTSVPVSHRPSVRAALAARGGSLSTAGAIGGIVILVLLAGLAVVVVLLPSGRGQHVRMVAAQPGHSAPSALADRVAARISQHSGPSRRKHSRPPGAHRLEPSPVGGAAGSGHWGRGERSRAGSGRQAPSRRRGPGYPSPSGGGQPGFWGPKEAGVSGPDYGSPGPGRPSFAGAGHLGGASARHQGQFEAGQVDALRPERLRPEPMLADADEQPTGIGTTADHTAAEISQAAAEQAATALTAAEQEAARLRDALAETTAELGRATASVRENLPDPVKLSTKSWTGTSGQTARPAARPDRPGAESTAALAAPGAAALAPEGTRPASPAPTVRATTWARRDRSGRPATRPGVSRRRDAKPMPKPAGAVKGRQVSAWHKMVAALVALSLIGVGSAAAEIDLHGFSFFVFRNAGAGAGNVRNLNENQGPGQPDAPGARNQAAQASGAARKAPSQRADQRVSSAR
jgi:hypothetical protein